TRYAISYNAPRSKITAIQAAADDLLWISTEEEGIVLCAQGHALSFNSEQGLSDNFTYNTVVLSGSSMAVGTDRGLNILSIKNGKVEDRIYTTSNGLPDNIVRVIKPVPGTSWYWLGTQQGGLAMFCNKTKNIWIPQVASGWQWGQVNDILPVDAHKIWVTTEQGFLLKVNLLDSNHIKVTPYSFDRRLEKLIKDKAGNL